jgi:hypothetical protein
VLVGVDGLAIEQRYLAHRRRVIRPRGQGEGERSGHGNTSDREAQTGSM